MTKAEEASTTNVIRLHDYLPSVPQSACATSKTPEMALMLALLSALSVGGKQERRIFGLIGWELEGLSARAPADVSIAAAGDIFCRVREANYGR